MSEADTAHAPGAWTARLRLDPTAFIAPGAVLVGDVTLGARSSVWFNAVLRGDIAAIEVGADSNVQDGAVVHVDDGMPTRIASRVTIGHGAIIHGCTIEEECLIGMGAIVLSGARVGAGSLVAAGALVRERQVIPPGSIALGMPAKVVGQTTPEHRAGLERGLEHYVALGRSYIERGFSGPHPYVLAPGGIARDRGPMSYLEWGQALAVLGESPGWAADRLERESEDAWRRRPGEGRWSALETLAHLRDADLHVFRPRLELMLTRRAAELPGMDVRDWPAQRGYQQLSPAAVLEEWVAVRRGLVARLAPLTREDWLRVGVHPVRGPYPLGEMVRAWADHDLSHRRQMAEALGEFA
jgi:carbonic anhydrase/acetyltransferase-like protein (isoleucine patch superfamily)